MTRQWRLAPSAVAVLVCLLAGTVAALAQVATGTITGTVKDGQGATVPGATVTLTSATRGTSLEAQTNENGDFVFPNVTGGTYNVKVALEGFKTLERNNIQVSPGDRIAIGTLTVEVGALNETVTVSGEIPVIQSQSGERSFTVSTEAVSNLPIAGRNWSSLTALTPGVIGTTRLGNAGTQNNNIMMDGVAIMDTGNNGQMLQTNVEAIAEVKILTSGISGRVRTRQRPADHRRDQVGHESISRIGLRRRAQLRLERQQLGQHQKR